MGLHYQLGLNGIRILIENHFRMFWWDAITHPSHNITSNLAKPSLMIWPKWIITFYHSTLIWLFIHAFHERIFHEQYQGWICACVQLTKKTCYLATSPLIGWAHTQNDPCNMHTIALPRSYNTIRHDNDHHARPDKRGTVTQVYKDSP